MNYELKLWWILLTIVILTFVLWIVIKIKEFGESGPEFLKYTKDTIQGWNWEWTWRKNYDGKYVVDDLHPVCESCGTPLAATKFFILCSLWKDTTKIWSFSRFKSY